MANIGLDIKAATRQFFDREAITSRMDRATRRVLSRFGAFVRYRARSSLRKRKKSSDPGEPPSSHLGLIKKFLFFVYEPRRESVVVGPALLNGRGGEDTLQLLEEGGTAVRQFFRIEETRTPSGRKRKRAKVKYVHSRKAPKRRVRYEPRPFMGPALERELPELPAMWRDAL